MEWIKMTPRPPIKPKRPYRKNPRKVDMTGMRFGRLLVIKDSPKTEKNRKTTNWIVACDCGKTKVVTRHALMAKNGNGVVSCGCYRRDNAYLLIKKCNLAEIGSKFRFEKKHGHCSNGKVTKTWWSWNSMIRRCYSETVDSKNYLRRGITVCERWMGVDGFKNFLSNMGERPTAMTLDRINGNGNYEPSNCRWADIKTQNRNKVNSIYIKLYGKRINLMEACETHGVNYHKARWLIRLGRKPEDVFNNDATTTNTRSI